MNSASRKSRGYVDLEIEILIRDKNDFAAQIFDRRHFVSDRNIFGRDRFVLTYQRKVS